MSVYTTKSGEQLDPKAPLTKYEKYLLEKFLSDPTQFPQKFKAWAADYVSNNGKLNVADIPSLKGEEWREVGATGQPAFSNSYVNYGGDRETAAFYKDVLGVVHLKGLVKSGTVGAAMFTLPAGYRPALKLMFATIANDTISRLDVEPDGDVIQINGSNAFVSLDVINFRAAA